LAKHVVDFEVN